MTTNTAKQLDTLPQRETIQALGSEITFLHREPGLWSLTQVRVPRDVMAPPHDHDFDESYYVMSGSLWLTVGGTQFTLGAGEFAHIRGGTVHGFKGTSDVPTLILIHQSPGDADDFFRACAREIKNLPADMMRVPALAAKHGIRVAPTTCTTPR